MHTSMHTLTCQFPCALQHRRRVIITAAQAGLPLPAFPLASHVFNAGGYNPAAPTEPCSLKTRQQVARRGVPKKWRKHVLVPTNVPLPRLSVHDVIGDLPEEEAEGPVAYARWGAGRMGGGLC